MATFKDCKGREHSLRLIYPHLRQLRELGIPLQGEGAGTEIGTMLFGDYERLIKVVHLLLVEKMPMDELQEGIDGPTLQAAGTAVLDAVADFSPNSKIAELRKASVRRAIAEAEQQIQGLIDSKDSAANSPASAESRPTTAT